MPTITPDVCTGPKLTVVGGKASRSLRTARNVLPPADDLEAEAAALPAEFHREELDAVIALFRLIRSGRSREVRPGGDG